MGRDRAARKHDVEMGSQPLCYSQPCLLTPPIDPSGSESYSEQNLLSPARASRKREPLAAAGTRARSLNYEDAEDSACPALGGGAPLARPPIAEEGCPCPCPCQPRAPRGILLHPLPPSPRAAPAAARCDRAAGPAPPQPTSSGGGGGRAAVSQSAARALPVVTPAPPPTRGLAPPSLVIGYLLERGLACWLSPTPGGRRGPAPLFTAVAWLEPGASPRLCPAAGPRLAARSAPRAAIGRGRRGGRAGAAARSPAARGSEGRLRPRGPRGAQGARGPGRAGPKGPAPSQPRRGTRGSTASGGPRGGGALTGAYGRAGWRRPAGRRTARTRGPSACQPQPSRRERAFGYLKPSKGLVPEAETLAGTPRPRLQAGRLL